MSRLKWTSRGLTHSRHALTYGEMLVVAAVFLILSLLLVLSSQHVMVKSRHARVLQEQRVLADKLEFYELNFLDVPTSEEGLEQLVNPYNQVEQVPRDPFTPHEADPYEYYSDLSPGHKWVIVSRGPDGDLDIEGLYNGEVAIVEASGALSGGGEPREPEPDPTRVHRVNDFLVRNSYDPTNGTNSGGDIFRVYGRP